MTRKKKDTLYKLSRSVSKEGMHEFQVFKLNDDYEHIGTYNVSQIRENSFVCTCPAWKYPCKHVKMVQRFLEGESSTDGTLPLSSLFSLNQDEFVSQDTNTESTSQED